MSTLWSNWEFLPALLSFASAPHAHQQAILDWLVAYLVTSSRRSRIAEAVKGVPTGFRPTRSPVIRSLLTVIFTPEGDRALSSEGREKPWYEAASKSSAAANSSKLSGSQWQPVDVHDLRSRNPAGVLQSWRRALPKLVILAATVLATSHAHPAMAEGLPPPEVVVAHPKLVAVPQWDEYTGRFEPLQHVEVRPRVSGAIDTINFIDGQFVKEGDLLYVIDPRPYEIAVDIAKADLAKARAQVAVTALDATRAQHLIESSSITLRDADQRRANLDVAKAQQLSAEAALRNAELNLEWTKVRAPVSGRVSDHRVDVGNLVQGSQVGATLLTTIVTLDPIHFVFDASEADYIRYARLASASDRPSSREFRNPVKVRLADEADWSTSHSGVMDFLDNQINARAGIIRGRAIFENKDLFLLPGTFGRLRLFSGNIDAFLIPDATILSDQASKVVLTVGLDGKVVQKPVTLGAIYRGLRVVMTGLTEADRIVIAGVANPFVRPGAVVDAKDGAISMSTDTASN
jgi:multidrug efflux system membrane fusion protein